MTVADHPRHSMPVAPRALKPELPIVFEILSAVAAWTFHSSDWVAGEHLSFSSNKHRSRVRRGSQSRE